MVKITFALVYPLCVNKIESKGRCLAKPHKVKE
jgi:hypothetical protein